MPHSQRLRQGLSPLAYKLIPLTNSPILQLFRGQSRVTQVNIVTFEPRFLWMTFSYNLDYAVIPGVRPNTYFLNYIMVLSDWCHGISLKGSIDFLETWAGFWVTPMLCCFSEYDLQQILQVLKVYTSKQIFICEGLPLRFGARISPDFPSFHG